VYFLNVYRPFLRFRGFASSREPPPTGAIEIRKTGQKSTVSGLFLLIFTDFS